jgi:hypothetical protein
MSNRATYQFCLIVISVLFESVRGGGWTGCYSLLCMEEIYLRSFIYFLCEHFIIISLAVMVWQNSGTEQDIKTDRFFVLLCVVDLMDYVVTGNVVWEKLLLTSSKDSWFFILPLSMNVVSVVCFFIYANWQWRINMNGRR